MTRCSFVESCLSQYSARQGVASLSLLAVLLASFAGPAAAQTTGSLKWEVEVHAGGMLVSNPSNGTVSLPGPGEPFTTSFGPGFPGFFGFPSRRVSSWYFGDGATLLNQVSAAPPFNRPLSMVALDPVLGGLLAERRHGGSFGVRISRALNARLTAEFGLDYSLAQLEITRTALRQIEATTGSFLAMWTQLQSTGPFFQPRTTSKADIRDGKARQIVSTGMLNINLKTSGNLIPYVTAGGGVISSVGDTPGATLSGNYQFQWVNLFPINESDTVSVRDSRPDHAPVGVFGGGVRLHATPRWGVRFDVRGYLSRNKVRTLVDAQPTTAPATPSFVFFSATNPSIQFSNLASQPSSLSGPRMDGVQTFSGSGIQSQLSLTAGVFWRF